MLTTIILIELAVLVGIYCVLGIGLLKNGLGINSWKDFFKNLLTNK